MTAIYFIVSLVWVVVTDSLVLMIRLPDLNTLQLVNIAKGVGFVCLSALALKGVAHHEANRYLRTKQDFQLLFRSNPYPMWVYDMETYAFIEVNDAAIAKYGYTRDEFLAMRITDIRPPAEVPRLLENLANPRATLAHSGTWIHRLKDGSEISVEIGSHLLEYAGRPAALVIAHDVTDRVTAEQQVRYQAMLIETVADAIIATDNDFVIRSWNKAAEQLYGWTAEEAVGRPVRDIIPVEFIGTQVEEVVASFRQHGAWKGEAIQKQRSGSDIHVLTSVATTRDAHGQPTGSVAINRDITQRKQDELLLRQYNERLETLSQKLVEAHEAERRHIARELHDEIGQSLTALSLLISSEAAAQQHGSTQAQQFISDLIGKVRTLSLDLRPSMLDDLGLLPTLDWYFERFRKTTGICIDFRQSGADRRFHSTLETTLYRVIQEALTNIARHAGVEAAVVRLWVRDAVELQIADQGSGFDVCTALKPERGTAGLSGIIERVRLVGGTCTMDATPGEGTTVMVRLPIRDAEGG